MRIAQNGVDGVDVRVVIAQLLNPVGAIGICRQTFS